MALRYRTKKNSQGNQMDIKEEMFHKAVDILKMNSSREGIKAASTVYNQVWSRDTFITALGANMLEDPILLEAVKNSLLTLGRRRSPLGMIPVNFDLDRQVPRFFHAGAVDANSWYIIGLANLYSTVNNLDDNKYKSLKETFKKELLGEALDYAMGAYKWLRYQDTNNAVLIDSMPGSDWMDSSVKRQGKVLYNNILFVMATKCINNLCAEAGKSLDDGIRLDYGQLVEKFNAVFAPAEEVIRGGDWPNLHDFDKDVFSSLPEGKLLYHPQFITMNYVDMHFDSLSNLMSVIIGLSSHEMSRSIMSYISSNNIASPYPIKVMYPTYSNDDPFYDKAYTEGKLDYWRNDQNCYHNGSVWPFVGGFYVLALNKMGDPAVLNELENLAKANALKRKPEEHGFNEWMHGLTGEPKGQDAQSWNAGLYIAAYMASKGRDPFQFLREEYPARN